MLRIIDANLNRTGEGLRLLEEIARLLLNDTELTQQLKNLRHKLLRDDIPFHVRLLNARQADNDVGACLEVPGEDNDRSPLSTIIANAKRVQESLRVLEEVTKVPGAPPELVSKDFQKARFDIYTIEQKLAAGLLRKGKLERLQGLYVVLDTEALKGRDPVKIARQAINGGASTIQLRDKVSARKAILPVARQLANLCRENNILFIVNDNLDVALDCDADGLHVGQQDLPVNTARKLMPADKLIGASVETVAQAVAAKSEGADHLGVGGIFPTGSRADTPVVGLKRLREIRRSVSIPLVGIGGIDKDNAGKVIAAGASAVAVISAVLEAKSPERAAREIVEKLEADK